MSNDPIPTVRSVIRAVTLRVGVITDHFLGRGRPLAQSRLLSEIGRHGADIRELRSRLGLDSGYLSRLLRSVEREGLVVVSALESDRRSHRARLTAAGLRELKQLDRLGDRFADAKWCLAQYFAELGEHFMRGFDVASSIPADAAELIPPHGTFLVARLDGRPVGCGAVKATAPGVGSINWMWVSRSVRGNGVGPRLLLALEKEAAGRGIELLRLETNGRLHEAQAHYRPRGPGVQRRASCPPLVREAQCAPGGLRC